MVKRNGDTHNHKFPELYRYSSESEADSGVYIQFKLPQTVNLDRLIKRLSARQVKAVTGKSFYLTNWLEREKFLRISIPRVRPERNEEGVRVIMEEVRRENKKSPSDS